MPTPPIPLLFYRKQRRERKSKQTQKNGVTDCEQARRMHGNRNGRRYIMCIGGEALHHPRQTMTLPLLAMLPSSPTNMAVRCQWHCIALVGSDMEGYRHWDGNLVRWMAHPQFDMAEFNRLCRHYKLD
jgi:hypothetical protein